MPPGILSERTAGSALTRVAKDLRRGESFRAVRDDAERAKEMVWSLRQEDPDQKE